MQELGEDKVANKIESLSLSHQTIVKNSKWSSQVFFFQTERCNEALQKFSKARL